MPVKIVDLLQTIKVQHKQRKRAPGAAIAFDLGVESFNQKPIIGETGQRVADGQQVGMFFLTPAFGNLGGEHEREKPHYGQKRLHQKKRMVRRFGDKWPVTAKRSNHSNGGKYANSGGSFPLPKPKCSPHKKGGAQKCQRVALQRIVESKSENNGRSCEHGNKQSGSFSKLPVGPSRPRICSPQHEKRSKDQRPCCVTEPPGTPHEAVILPRSESSQSERSHANSSSNSGTTNRSVESKPENIQSFFKRAKAVGKFVDEVAAQKGLDGVAKGNSSGRERRASGCDVNNKRAEKNSRPKTRAKCQQSCECNAGGWPNRSYARMNRGEPQAKFSCDDVNSGDRQPNQQVLQVLTAEHS